MLNALLEGIFGRGNQTLKQTNKQKDSGMINNKNNKKRKAFLLRSPSKYGMVYVSRCLLVTGQT